MVLKRWVLPSLWKCVQSFFFKCLPERDCQVKLLFIFSLFGDSQLKLGDAALSRDLFSSDYHCLGDNENRPIKWMPIEAIGMKKYSRASDIVRHDKNSVSNKPLQPLSFQAFVRSYEVS